MKLWYPAKRMKRKTHRDYFEELPSGKIVQRDRANSQEQRLKRTLKTQIKRLIDVASRVEPEIVKESIKKSIYLNAIEKDAITAKVEDVAQGKRKSIFDQSGG